MSVPKGERKTSKEEFSAIYFRVHDDAVDMVNNGFRAKPEEREKQKIYVESASKELYQLIWNLIYNIKCANALFPTTSEELLERRIYQDKAIGICQDILTLYDIVMHKLHVRNDAGAEETQHLIHQINSLKAWRTSDNKRFKSLR